MPVSVSIVVPTYQRPDLLRRCLSALMDQEFDAEAYEIIVADDAASETTRRLVENLAETRAGSFQVSNAPVPVPLYDGTVASKEYYPTSGLLADLTPLPKVRYVPVPHTRGPAAARNRGWEATEGEIVAFIDDDCIPSPTWLKNGMAAIQKSGAAGVSGRVIVPYPINPTDYELNAAELQFAEFVTANCFYRRRVLEEVRGFDERFSIAWREDSDLFFTLLEKGYPLEKAPGAIVYHPIRSAPWGISLKQQQKNFYNALLYKKHPALYRRKLQAFPPWRYYIALLTLVTSLLAALMGFSQIGVVSLAAWAVMTLMFTWQRLKFTRHNWLHISEMLVTSVLIPPLAIYWRLRGAFRFRVFFF